jgi:hypothetical protein
MGYRWWQHASRKQLAAIAVAIQGLGAGFAFRGDAQFGAIRANVDKAYAKH